MVRVAFARKLEQERDAYRAVVRDVYNRLSLPMDGPIIAVAGIALLQDENARLAAALKDLTVRFAKVQSLYFDLGVKAGTTEAALRQALNGLLRCHDYGNATTKAEWEKAAQAARLVG